MACPTLRPKAALPLVRERGSHLASNRKDSLADGEVLAVLLRVRGFEAGPYGIWVPLGSRDVPGEHIDLSWPGPVASRDPGTK